MRKPKTFTYGGRARIFKWYELNEADVFKCRCGWSGTFSECATELFDELVDATCQKCDTMLAIRGHPSTDETRRAAARGDARAVKDLPLVDKIEARWARAESLQLTADSPLSDFGAAAIDFTWDLEEADGEHWTLIRVGDRVVWRELAYWEGHERFYQVRSILRERYGSAFASLTPTDASWMYLFGDDVSAASAYLKQNPRRSLDASNG